MKYNQMLRLGHSPTFAIIALEERSFMIVCANLNLGH